MSKTATCGTFGIKVSIAFIPKRLAGLCRGASSQSFSIPEITSLSTILLDLKSSPPCATLCPTAPISSRDLRTPNFESVRMSNTFLIPTVWFGIGYSASNFSLPSTLCERIPLSRPILSTKPLANNVNWDSDFISST